MPEIEVHDPKGVAHRKASFHATAAGTYSFPDDPAYSGWLEGQERRGVLTVKKPPPQVDAYGPEALGPTAGSLPEGEEAAPSFAPGAEGLTPGSTPGEALADPEDPNQFAPGAEGLTPGSTPGPAPEEADREKDAEDAEATQHPERAPELRDRFGASPRRRGGR